MANPTISDAIPGSTQDAVSITIPKASLALLVERFQTEILKLSPDSNFLGFLPTSANNAEEIFSSLMMAGSLFFTQAAKDADNSGDRQLVIEYSRFSTSTDIDGNITANDEFVATLFTPFQRPFIDPSQF